MTKILEDLILKNCLPFLNNISVKGLLFIYNNKEAIPSIWQYVLKYIQSLNRTLVRLERAGCIIRSKSQFCINRISIVSFVYKAEGRSLDSAKVIKILKWKPCTDIRKARAFIKVCVYYQIWIKNFFTIAKPIYYLFKKGVP